ncbi:hypothetical protein B0H16DRAFT_1517271 [Mycena metata]|uniref:Uncharacterized protein n=1 Tax=Mycena metata TaxID=1033252 RepID=A0AAD7JR62_9AGAR|nr:hypothetical protein B0H16DRAFT_1517271 [Mycena metata]
MTTCETALVDWIYTPLGGEDVPDLMISITNVGVPQGSPPISTTVSGTFNPNPRRSSPSRRDLITETLTPTPITPSVGLFQWSSVNVTAGSYAMVANLTDTSTVVQSLPFFVVNGPDVSCTLAPASTTSSGPVSTASSGSGTSTASGGQPTSSGSTGTLPVSGSSSHKSVNKGAIAGGVIGGLAVIAAAIAAYFYIRYASASTAPGAARNRSRKWDGLGSTDSKARGYPTAVSGRHNSQADSVGPILSHDSNVYVIGSVGIDSRPSRINDGLDEDEGISDFYPSQEKISGSPSRSNPFSESGHDDDSVPLDLITPLPGSAVTRNSSTSTSSYMNNNFSRPRSHPGSPYGSPTSPSGDSPFSNNNTSSSLNHPESSYPPTATPSPAFPSGTSQDGSFRPRRGSAGEPLASGSRRTPRKPVPQYNPTDPALTSPPPPPMPTLPQDSDSSREGSLRSIGAGDVPRLSHKASFGAEGRAVHYLIPDMPPPQRD